jgi:hypothetical protein
MNLFDWHISHPWPKEAKISGTYIDDANYAEFGTKLEKRVKSKIFKMIKREDITLRIMKIFKRSYDAFY